MQVWQVVFLHWEPINSIDANSVETFGWKTQLVLCGKQIIYWYVYGLITGIGIMFTAGPYEVFFIDVTE